MANETLISVPTDLPVEVRQFLVRLVGRLDQVIGARANDPAAGATDLAAAVAQLNARSQSIQLTLQAFATGQATAALGTANEYTDGKIEDLEQPPIADLGYTAVTVSGSFVQAEVQQIASDLQTVADKLDTLLAALRTAGLLEV